MSYANYLSSTGQKAGTAANRSYMDAIRSSVAKNQGARQSKVDKYAASKGITPGLATTGSSMFRTIDPETRRPYADNTMAPGWNKTPAGMIRTGRPITSTMNVKSAGTLGTSPGPTGTSPTGNSGGSAANLSTPSVAPASESNLARLSAGGLAAKRRSSLR